MAIPFPPTSTSPSAPLGSVCPPSTVRAASPLQGGKAHPTAGLESCCCPGSLSESRCHFPSAGISAQDFLLSLVPGCQCPAAAPQATGAGRGVHKETTQAGVWPVAVAEPCIPDTFWRGQISIMGCPTPPAQKAEDSCCIPSDWQKPWAQPSAGTGKCHRAGTPCPVGTGGTLWLWGSLGANNSRATPQHKPTGVPSPSWVPRGSGHCPCQSHPSPGATPV